MIIINLIKFFIMTLRFRSVLLFVGVACIIDTFFPVMMNPIILIVLVLFFICGEMYFVVSEHGDYIYSRPVNKKVINQKIFVQFDNKTQKFYILDGSIKNTHLRKMREPMSYLVLQGFDQTYFTKENNFFDDVFVREQRQYFAKLIDRKEGVK